MTNPFSTGWQWSVRIMRAVLCVVIAALGVQLAFKMAYVFGPAEASVVNETPVVPDFNFAAAPFSIGHGTWKVNSDRGKAFLNSVPVEEVPAEIARLCEEQLSLTVPADMLKFSSRDNGRQPVKKKVIDQHEVSIVSDRNRILLIISSNDQQFHLLAIKLSPTDCLISLAANQAADLKQPKLADWPSRGLGLELPKNATLIAARSNKAGQQDAQIVGVAGFNWDDLLKNWKTDGWTIELNPLANHNKADAFCIKLPNIIRVWTIGEDEGQTILVITKLQSDSA